MADISLVDARRIALRAQGFSDPRPTGKVTLRHFRRALERMSILQLDAVNVLCRSHFLPMFARLGPYDQDQLDAWIWNSGENHEYVAHEASITAMKHYPLLRHRMSIDRWKSGSRFRDENPEYLDGIRAAVEEEGALSVKDLSNAGERTGPWWGWSKGKIALEVMYRLGELAIAERTKTFLTRYDLPERVVPSEYRTDPAIDAATAQSEMLLLGAKSHGIGTAKDLADYFRLKMPAVRPLLQALVDAGRLEAAQVEGWDDAAYMLPKTARPQAIKAETFLSPFDPVMWFRPRAARLFNFEYRIEIYVPEAKRKYGYFVLPFLLDDNIVGRVDLKADRQAGTLRAKAAFIETGFEANAVAEAMARSLVEMNAWLGLDQVAVGRRGNLARSLSGAVRSLQSL